MQQYLFVLIMLIHSTLWWFNYFCMLLLIIKCLHVFLCCIIIFKVSSIKIFSSKVIHRFPFEMYRSRSMKDAFPEKGKSLSQCYWSSHESPYLAARTP